MTSELDFATFLGKDAREADLPRDDSYFKGNGNHENFS